MIIGYTTGVFDLFHVGHLNILKEAKSKCNKLVVGVTTDELTKKLKNKSPIIPFEERKKIVESIKYVDEVYDQCEIDEIGDHRKIGFHIIFKGSDWENSAKWNNLSEKFKEKNVKIVFIPYTKTTSSTIITQKLVHIM